MIITIRVWKLEPFDATVAIENKTKKVYIKQSETTGRYNVYKGDVLLRKISDLKTAKEVAAKEVAVAALLEKYKRSADNDITIKEVVSLDYDDWNGD